ncbi:MAG: ornithine cyclodeaminase family protein [Thermoanaerobaculia bacterium]
MKPAGTLLLTRSEVAALLDLDACIAAVEQAFRLHGQRKTKPPGILGFPYPDGGFHIKAAGLDLDRPYFAVKTNGNFFRNAERFGMPAIQGVIALCDGENGYPLALLDSIEITIARTGAATAVAAKHLARPDSAVVTICGCGNQGRVQLRAITRACPIRRAFAFDAAQEQAERFAEELSGELGIRVEAVTDLPKAVRASDICVTCTPSRRAFLRREDVTPGTFVAAVGADSPEKQELEPELLASGKVVADILEQCATIGELHHALEQGLMSRDRVHAELGEVIAGRRPGRQSDAEIIVFDSTGMALEDVAAAVLVYERAVSAGAGRTVNLAG